MKINPEWKEPVFGMRIRANYDPPPIPNRAFDWSAYDDSTYDGAPDSKNRHDIGWGRTEEEAVADLWRLLTERAEAEEPEEPQP
jgi:hypothetical protein